MKRVTKLDTNNHSVFSLHYHLILTVKYRRKVLTDEIQSELEEAFNRLGEPHRIKLLEIGHDRDHVHFLFKAFPNSDISQFIRTFKTATSRTIRRNHPEIKRQLWKNVLWSSSYCLITAGGAPLEVIKEYIRTQGE